ncbi:MAG: site-specific integrase [Candidatus Lindowbacteria bacterium]|nr:site-specific integrase [Candidatus Lindowbacteria bacterium]
MDEQNRGRRTGRDMAEQPEEKLNNAEVRDQRARMVRGINPALGFSVTESNVEPGSELLRSLSRLELNKLVIAAGNIEDRTLLELLWESAAQMNEVLFLQVSDLDKDNQQVIFCSRRRGDYSGISNQTVEISNQLYSRLKRMSAQRASSEKIFGRTVKSARNMMKRLGESALGRSVNPESLLQGRAFELVAHGINPLLVARALSSSNLLTLVTHFSSSSGDSHAVPA